MRRGVLVVLGTTSIFICGVSFGMLFTQQMATRDIIQSREQTEKALAAFQEMKEAFDSLHSTYCDVSASAIELERIVNALGLPMYVQAHDSQCPPVRAVKRIR